MTTSAHLVPMLGFAAYSGTGKTTLLKQIVRRLTAGGLVVSVVKHAHHDFDIDYPGKDSYELRKSGARQTLIASDRRRALVTELPDSLEPEVDELAACLDTRGIDLIVVEGFRDQAFPKIELHRPSMGRGAMYPNDTNMIAVATDEPLTVDTELPTLDLNDLSAIVDFIRAWLSNSKQEPSS